jgi:hypothetical protein
MRGWFDFIEIPANHINSLGASNDPHAGVVGYFKDESIGDPVYEVIALMPKTYSVLTVTVCKFDFDYVMPPPKYKYKAVAKGITLENIKQPFIRYYFFIITMLLPYNT